MYIDIDITIAFFSPLLSYIILVSHLHSFVSVYVCLADRSIHPRKRDPAIGRSIEPI